MTEAQKLRQRSEYERIERMYKQGMIDLLDAAKWADDMWQRGTFAREEANMVLKLLAKVNTA